MRTHWIWVILFGVCGDGQTFAQVAPWAPSWWMERGVIESGRPADDFAVVNLGQIKNMFRAAVEEMDSVDGIGAGVELRQIVAGWSISGRGADDYGVANIGQLKRLGIAVYARLLELRAIDELPRWLDATVESEVYQPATLGQMKNVFALNFAGISEVLLGEIGEGMAETNSGGTEQFESDGVFEDVSGADELRFKLGDRRFDAPGTWQSIAYDVIDRLLRVGVPPEQPGGASGWVDGSQEYVLDADANINSID